MASLGTKKLKCIAFADTPVYHGVALVFQLALSFAELSGKAMERGIVFAGPPQCSHCGTPFLKQERYEAGFNIVAFANNLAIPLNFHD